MKTKIAAVIILFILIGFVYFMKTKTLSTELVHAIPVHIESPGEGEGGPEFEEEVLSLIADVNTRNKMVQSLTCNEVTIQATHEGGIPITLWSELHYQKDRRFRMVNRSRMGKEMDVGSNEEQFWFWSKRMRPPTLYYADHSDLIKVPLRPPLNPLWLMECMSVSKVDTKNAKARKHGDFWAIYQSRVSTLGTLMTKMTLIDPEHKRIVGHYLYDNEDNLIASNELLEFADCAGTSVPVKSKMCWHEEGVVMIFEFADLAINSQIKEELWAMPPSWNKQDMAELTPQFLQDHGTPFLFHL